MKITNPKASALLVKALLPLMSAKTSDATDDSPNKNEAIAAPDTEHRPTPWVMLRRKSKNQCSPPAVSSIFCDQVVLPHSLDLDRCLKHAALPNTATVLEA